MSNLIAIVGRPNVGKSTLFNRLTESRQSIMDNTSGVTRDRLYGQGEWNGKFFTLIDTGGYVVGSEDIFERAIREQVKIAVEEADIIFFVVDAQTGLTELDKDFGNILRQYKKPVFVIANKVDESSRTGYTNEFYALALGDLYPISAISGSGTGDLLDAATNYLQAETEENPYKGLPRIAILGRPNVGKSSFINLLLGKERSIVTDLAGTTRDSIDSEYKAYGKNFILTDTAGIRRKSRVTDNIEFYSVMRSIRALEGADVCIIMLDAQNGLEAQDINIMNLAERRGKGILLMINKWDLIEKDTKTAKKFIDNIQERIATMSYVPIIFTSVLEKQRVMQTIEKAIQIYESKNRRIPTNELNKALLPEIEKYPPPAIRGKFIKINYITQLPTKRVAFAFFCNHPQHIKEPYKRFLENQIRKYFTLEGVPIEIFTRKK
ncbi:MAG TPA: ribosome biogenesis GTPase Der [Microscillaceae bacterium]|jgi:GTP-binding protein|nr:ribosome biogenesis GTPase Der [Microscillaceae bacterium]